jgi:hypothetical protein
VADPCASIRCLPAQTCVPSQARCLDDPCQVTSCPAGLACRVRGDGLAECGVAREVAGALVILFVAQAGSAQRQLEGAKVERPNGAVGYSLPEAQARNLGAKANDNYSAALGVGIGAAALAVLSTVLWAQP